MNHITKRNRSLFADDLHDHSAKLRKKFDNKSILIIGGAGSIGSSFIKSLLPYKPRALIVVDRNENALAELIRDLRNTYGLYIPDEFMVYPMDFESNVFEKMFISRGGFDFIANFSAHKHVRSEKDAFSAEALIRNNVLNLIRLLDLLSVYPPGSFFCVSTDKAANPVNIMGASKKIMEDLIFSYSNKFSVTTARFANVAFSNGSLPFSFLERINKQQPITVPMGISRYFVSPQESGEICILACALGKSGEIFFPKLEKSQTVTFTDIAFSLLKELGYKPAIFDSSEQALIASEKLKAGDLEYPVYISKSDTTGEKDNEIFYTDNETIDLNRYKSLGVITTDQDEFSAQRLTLLLQRLNELFSKERYKKADIVDILTSYLPNFAHLEKGKNLDGKM
jgi:FlaA1/EpsC-like NDP-sugar epimerase